MVIVTTMLKVILAMALGFFLYKIRIFNSESNSALSKLVINVTCPCTLFASIVTLDSSEMQNVYKLLVIGVIFYAALALLAWAASKLLGFKGTSDGAARCLMIFGNIGMMGIPIVEGLYGTLGVSYIAVLNVHFNIFCFTYGVYLISRGAEGESRFSPKKLLSPAIISVVLAIIIYLLKIKLPDIVITPIQFIGGITSALAMITLGSIIATFPLKDLFVHWKLYIVSLIKLLAVPAVTYFALRAILGAGLIAKVVTMSAAMPAATVISMLALTNGGDSRTATCGTGLMLIMSIATIPMVYFMMEIF